MFVLPVLDVQHGKAVHGRAGERARYGPVTSVLTDDASPLGLATAFRECLDLSLLYVADLDAITTQHLNWSLYTRLLETGVHPWLDAGLRNVSGARAVCQAIGTEGWTPIVGLETLAGEDELARLLDFFTPQRLVVSLDLDQGMPRTTVETWRGKSAVELSEVFLRRGVSRLILLDLKRVGMGQGTGVAESVQALRAGHRAIELTAGGGVAGFEDAITLSQAGCDGLLLASTLHDGRIGRAELRRLGACV